MKIHGWGRYPVIHYTRLYFPKTSTDIQRWITQASFQGVARGMGRSYGDSALATQIIHMRYFDHFQFFDKSAGIIRCAAGVTLADLLSYIIPHGWFLPVTPGTKFVTLGGAVASDVHGKNHHLAGCFSDYVRELTLLQANGEIIRCSRCHNVELFCATCGGMGLTGIILSVEIQLKAISSAQIRVMTIKAVNLSELFERFEIHQQSTYSVAWIDCLAKNSQLGRSLLMLGEHATEGDFKQLTPPAIPILFDMPNGLLNHYSMRLFNNLYYYRGSRKKQEQIIHYDRYFYPLDRLLDWNRLYGKAGFTQYQCVIPQESGKEGITAILQRIVQSREGSFLAVLKKFGKANNNYLSFPLAGYTLAVDFKINQKILGLLDELDRIVLAFKGRIYLTKDARMSETTFKQSYPKWEIFQQIRFRDRAFKVFRSLQSTRLGLNQD